MMESKDDEKPYTNEDVKTALRKINFHGWSLYRASKRYNIPYSTLKCRSRNTNYIESDSIKIGRPFNLTTKQELEIVSYVKEIQEAGLKLTACDIRKYAYKISLEKYNNRFNSSKKIAGWDWWLSFKKRYDISTAVNFSTPVSSMDKSEKFFYIYKEYVKKYSLHENPHLIWTFVGSNFSYITDAEIGKSKKKPDTVNVMLSVNAAGQRGPSLIVSKKPVSKNEDDIIFKESFIKISGDGMIDENTFYEYLTFFVSKVSQERPMLIIIDSKNKCLSLNARIFTKLTGITILPIPFNQTFVLGAFHRLFFTAMKYSWRKTVGCFVKKIHHKPVSEDFITLFSPVCLQCTTTDNIKNSYRKTGLWPINSKVITTRKNNVVNEDSNESENSTNDDEIDENEVENIINISDLKSSLKDIGDDDEILIVLVG